jgi:serine/threonine-protein kinase
VSVGLERKIGSDLAGYRIERLLGRGRVGVVYLAVDTRLGRKVALRLISPEVAADARFRERFVRESELVASIDHPNIVPIYGAGETDGLLFVAMGFVEGEDLASLLARRGRLESERALVVVTRVAEALDAARWSRGLVHGSLKPSDVLLAEGAHDDSGERVFLLGFGLRRELPAGARPAQAPKYFGNVDYVAPEQIEGRSASPRSDVYALGCLLLECLSGTPPFQAASPEALLEAHLHEPPPSATRSCPGLPVGLDGVIAKAMAKWPEERYSTCGELAAAARAVLSPRGEEVEDERSSPVAFSSRPKQELREEPPPSLASDWGSVVSPRLSATRLRASRAKSLAAIGLVVLLGALVAGGIWLRGRDPGDARSAPVASPADESAVRASEGRAEPLAEATVAPAEAAAEASPEPLAWKEPGSLVRIDATTGETLAQIAIPSPFALVSDGESVWALGGGDTGMLLVRVDAATGAVTDVFDAGSYPPGGPSGFAAISGSAWVSDGQPHRFSPGARTPEQVELDVDGPPGFHSPVAAAGSLWGVVYPSGCCLGPTDLLRVDPDTREVLARIEGVGPVAAAGKGFLWAFRAERGSDPPSLVRIDTRTQETTPVGELAGTALAPNYAVADGAVWATWKDGTLHRLDPVTGDESERVSLWTGQPSDVPLAAGAGAVWAANQRDRTLTRYEIATGKVTTTIPVHGAPKDVVFAEGSIWVTLGEPVDQVPGHPDLGALGTGTNALTVDGVPFSFTAPTSGWQRFGNISINKEGSGGQDAEAIIFWTSLPNGDHADPCANLLTGQGGRSVGALASAVARAPGTELVAGPSDVTLGGHAAKHVVVTVRTNLGCDPGFFFTWEDVDLGALWPETSPGDTISVWIVQVDGKRLFIEAETNPDAADLEQEVQQIIASISFDRPTNGRRD